MQTWIFGLIQFQPEKFMRSSCVEFNMSLLLFLLLSLASNVTSFSLRTASFDGCIFQEVNLPPGSKCMKYYGQHCEASQPNLCKRMQVEPSLYTCMLLKCPKKQTDQVKQSQITKYVHLTFRFLFQDEVPALAPTKSAAAIIFSPIVVLMIEWRTGSINRSIRADFEDQDCCVLHLLAGRPCLVL